MARPVLENRIGEAMEDGEIMMTINMIDVGPGDSYVVDIRCTQDQTFERDSWERHIIDTGTKYELYDTSTQEGIEVIEYKRNLKFPSRLPALQGTIDDITPVNFTSDKKTAPRIASFTATRFDADRAGNDTDVLKHIATKNDDFRPILDRSSHTLGPTTVYSYPISRPVGLQFVNIDIGSVSDVAGSDEKKVVITIDVKQDLKGMIRTFDGKLVVSDVKFLARAEEGKALEALKGFQIKSTVDNFASVSEVTWNQSLVRWSDVVSLELTMDINTHDNIRVCSASGIHDIQHSTGNADISADDSITTLGVSKAESIDAAIYNSNWRANYHGANPRFEHFYLRKLLSLPEGKLLSSDGVFAQQFSADKSDHNPFRESRIMSAVPEVDSLFFEQLWRGDPKGIDDAVVNQASLVQMFDAYSLAGEHMFSACFTGNQYAGWPNPSRLDALIKTASPKFRPLILKVPNHGSDTTIDKVWDHICASVYLISGSFPTVTGGHPTEKTLEKIIDTSKDTMDSPRIIFVSPDTRRGRGPGFATISGTSNIERVLRSKKSTAKRTDGKRKDRNYRCFALKTQQDDWLKIQEKWYESPPNERAAIGRIHVGWHLNAKGPSVEWNRRTDPFTKGNLWEDITRYE